MTPLSAVPLTLVVNGRAVRCRIPAQTTLTELLRSHLALPGTKVGCGVGECGACTVLVDDVPVVSCLVLAAELEGRRITTIETDDDAAVAVLRRTFVTAGGLQCGFCTPGMILAASRLPAGADPVAIRAGLAGNLCRCTGYVRIVAAVQQARRQPRRRRARRGG